MAGRVPCGEVEGVAMERRDGVAVVVRAVTELWSADSFAVEVEFVLAAVAGATVEVTLGAEETDAVAGRVVVLGEGDVVVARAVVTDAADEVDGVLVAGLTAFVDSVAAEGVVATAGVLETTGVVRGGATTGPFDFGAEDAASLALTISLSASGGASRSSSRAAGGVPPAGWRPAPPLALSERLRIRGVSEGGLPKFNSPGAAPGCGCVAGEDGSGMTHLQINLWLGYSRFKPFLREDFVNFLLLIFR